MNPVIIFIIMMCCIYIKLIHTYVTVYKYNLCSNQLQNLICILIILILCILIIYYNNNIFMIIALVPLSLVLYNIYQEYKSDDQSNEIFERALTDGTLGKMLMRDPHTEGPLCMNGVCAMTANEFLKQHREGCL